MTLTKCCRPASFYIFSFSFSFSPFGPFVQPKCPKKPNGFVCLIVDIWRMEQQQIICTTLQRSPWLLPLRFVKFVPPVKV